MDFREKNIKNPELICDKSEKNVNCCYALFYALSLCFRKYPINFLDLFVQAEFHGFQNF